MSPHIGLIHEGSVARHSIYFKMGCPKCVTEKNASFIRDFRTPSDDDGRSHTHHGLSNEHLSKVAESDWNDPHFTSKTYEATTSCFEEYGRECPGTNNDDEAISCLPIEGVHTIKYNGKHHP